MTQRDFNLLPLNLTPWQVRQILGASDEMLRALREQHPDLVVRRCGRGKHVYSKAKVAALAKLAYE